MAFDSRLERCCLSHYLTLPSLSLALSRPCVGVRDKTYVYAPICRLCTGYDSHSLCVCMCGSHKCAADKRKDTAKDAGCQTGRGAAAVAVGGTATRLAALFGSCLSSVRFVAAFWGSFGCFIWLAAAATVRLSVCADVCVSGVCVSSVCVSGVCVCASLLGSVLLGHKHALKRIYIHRYTHHYTPFSFCHTHTQHYTTPLLTHLPSSYSSATSCPNHQPNATLGCSSSRSRLL